MDAEEGRMERIDGLVDGVEGCLEWMDGWMDGLMDGWMDGCMYGVLDGWMYVWCVGCMCFSLLVLVLLSLWRGLISRKLFSWQGPLAWLNLL